MLHTVNKSPFDRNSLEACLRHAQEGSTILLIEDGIYAAATGTRFTPVVEAAMKKFKICALSADVKARGMQERIIDGIEIVDYSGFVDLVEQNERVQSWL